MKKHEFLQELLRRLSQLSQAEREKAYAFYAEIIDDSIEDGLSEDEAVAKLGGMDEIIERIAGETPMASPVRTDAGRKQNRKGTVLLLALGFPVWFPLLIAAASVLFSLFAVLWAVDLALWATFAACAAGVVGGIAGLVVIPELGSRLLGFGGAMVCAGFAALLYPACLRITRAFAAWTRRLWRMSKRAWMKREET
jgi:uncharacterized membrane protein